MEFVKSLWNTCYKQLTLSIFKIIVVTIVIGPIPNEISTKYQHKWIRNLYLPNNKELKRCNNNHSANLVYNRMYYLHKKSV